MKTPSIHWQDNLAMQRENRMPGRWDLAVASRALLHLMTALLPALLFPLLTAWAVGSGALEYVAATWWAGGFVFLALAVETNGVRKKWLLASGVAAMALAWAGSRYASEFVVLAAILPAAWFAMRVLKGLPMPGNRQES